MIFKSRILNFMRVVGTHFPIWTIAICFMVLGCGGGGSSPGGVLSGLAYTGKSTPVSINNGNAGSVSSKSFTTGSNTRAFSIFTDQDGEASNQEDKKNYSYLLDVSKTVKSAVDQIDADDDTAMYSTSAVKKDKFTRNGDNGGSATYELQADSETGDFLGNITFNNYRNDDMALTGSAKISGVYNPAKEDFDYFSMEFDNVTGKSATEHIIMDGEFSISNNDGELTFAMSMVTKDVILNRSYKVENFELSIKEDNEKTEMTIDGRFYDPDEGYVDLKTLTPFVMYNTDDNFSSGTLDVYGAEGTGGKRTMARLIIISNTQYQVKADTDGDNYFDYDSGHVYWD